MQTQQPFDRQSVTSSNKKPEKLINHFVVGIGASAGGLEAINELFDNIPKGGGFSYVVVQHLSPNYKSLMDELLAKHTQMKIVRAEEGEVILPDHVYLIPNKKNMTIKDGKLHLTDKLPSGGPNNAIDIFLESLAIEKKERAIAIILSGTGSDGTKGIQTIKAHGGLVIVQDPATAKFNGMPKSAISSGNTDFILPPELMWEEIVSHPHQPVKKKNTPICWSENGEDFLSEILALIREHTSHDFSSYKEQTLRRRIMRRMVRIEIDNAREYLYFLWNNPDEIECLGQEFLIGVTKFFRDTEAFELFKEQVIPELFGKKIPGSALKVWVAACSTGEEAYSIAILLCDYMLRHRKDINVKIFATDIDLNAIEFAAKGVYPESIKNDVSQEILERYFVKEGKNYCVNQQIRRMVIFAQHNVVKDPPFSKMDLVSCRNMLIYMKPTLQKKVLATFHFALKVGGYLFLGSSESSDEIKGSLQVVSKKWNLFKVLTKSKNFIFDGNVVSKEKLFSQKTADVRPKQKASENEMLEVFQELVAEELGFAAVYINEEYELIQAVGDYKKFIEIPDKILQLNLLKLVPRELSVALTLALRKAVRDNEKVVSKRIDVLKNDILRSITIAVKPYLNPDQYGKKFIVILFKEESREPINADKSKLFEHQVSINRFIELENELKQVKNDLQATVEELETSNEEMQSSNEELISSNEELQSTNEELQSLNEELHTVNAEHQQKIRELEELNDDLNNYFRGTDIGQIFLDRNLIIRKFTPAVRKQVNLIESDIGRPIEHLSYNIKDENLLEDIRFVIDTSEVIQKEIELRDGKHYQMKIMPYVRQDKTTDGAVVTFVDINDVKSLNNLLQGVLNSSLNGIMAFEVVRGKYNKVKDFKWTLINSAAVNLFGIQNENLIGKLLTEELPALKENGLFNKFVMVAEKGKGFNIEYKYQQANGNAYLRIAAVPIESGIAVTMADITQEKAAEEELREAYDEVKETEEKLRKLNENLEKRVEERTRELSESEERFRLVASATNDAVWDWDLITNSLWWNDGFHDIFGYEVEKESEGIQSWFGRLHEDEKESVMASVYNAINKGERQWSAEHRFLKADGSYAFVYNRGYVLKNEYGIPCRMLGSMVDLTKLKEVQNDLEESNKRLRKINVDLDNFVYTASHDLKAPVANLEGLVSLLKPSLEVKVDDRELRILDMIAASINKFKGTIIGLTEITKVQKDQEQNKERLSFEEVLEDVKIDVKQLMSSCNAIIEIDFQVPEIVYTRINLRSIFYNLLSNALKYCAEDRTPVVKIKTERKDEYVLLTFSDNGLGMNEKQLKKLFTMFKRFHHHIDGTGIGLYMVKRIIENNEGRIEVESELDKGTTFRIYLKKETEEEHQSKERECFL